MEDDEHVTMEYTLIGVVDVVQLDVAVMVYGYVWMTMCNKADEVRLLY